MVQLFQRKMVVPEKTEAPNGSATGQAITVGGEEIQISSAPVTQISAPIISAQAPTTPGGSWECVIEPLEEEGSLRWRQCLIEALRPQLESRLHAEPNADKFSLACSAWHQAKLRRVTPDSEGPLRLQVSASARGTVGANPNSSPRPDSRLVALGGKPSSGASQESYPEEVLPSERLQHSFAKLVGLEDQAKELLLYLDCFCGDALARWGEVSGQCVPVPLLTRFSQSVPLFLLYGDPGVGKSVLVRGVADAFCRQKSTSGSLISVGTEVRGSGLVGDFSQKLREAFSAVRRLPGSGLRVLVVDEAEAIAMRRSESAAHQEDRAATNTLLQCLDALQGEPGIAVFLTTNRLEALDPALLRRCALTLQLSRPGDTARAVLLSAWLGQVVAVDSPLVHASQAMTAADLENTLTRAFLIAVRQGQALSEPSLALLLTQAPRTQPIDTPLQREEV